MPHGMLPPPAKKLFMFLPVLENATPVSSTPIEKIAIVIRSILLIFSGIYFKFNANIRNIRK